MTVYEGVSFTFICQYSFETAGTVTLTPSPADIVSGSSTSDGITTGFKNGLFGTVSTTSFAGPYVCTIEIEGHTLSKEKRLEIVPVPSAPALETLTLQFKDYNWLTCMVTSDLPLFTVDWYTDDKYVVTHR